ncbi:hypothetical protein NFI96_008582 [Prochilodus magdalenae]|nr:hypothetical protein NFI96_008582 [Prochilodus magdalenae]
MYCTRLECDSGVHAGRCCTGADIWPHGVLMGSCAADTSAPSNVALRKTATQSGNYSTCYAGLAIDGNRDSDISNGSCSSTDSSVQPWWRVDLLVVYQISSIIITNRGDCCPDRLIGAEVRIGNSLDNNGNNNSRCAVIPKCLLQTTFTVHANMYGRYSPITKKKNLRIEFHSSEDLKDSTVGDRVLQELKTDMVHKGVSADQLYWTRLPEAEDKQGPVDDREQVDEIWPIFTELHLQKSVSQNGVYTRVRWASPPRLKRDSSLKMTRCHSESLHDSLSCVVQPSADGAALTGGLMEDTTARWRSGCWVECVT